MKRILELGLLLMFSSVSLWGAKNSHVFLLPADARVGIVLLPKGKCSFTWTETSGLEAQLTIMTKDKKMVTVAARQVFGKPNYTGVVTFVDNGITYLEEIDTANTRFIVRDPPNGQK